MLIDEGGGQVDVEADAIFRSGEPTVYEFVAGQPEQATRYTYTAAESLVDFSLVVSGEALKSPKLIATVARQWAATWNQNAQVPGVTDIAETQEVRPLGSLEDVVQVAVESTSGRSTAIITLRQSDSRPDVFAQRIADERATLDALEKG